MAVALTWVAMGGIDLLTVRLVLVCSLIDDRSLLSLAVSPSSTDSADGSGRGTVKGVSELGVVASEVVIGAGAPTAARSALVPETVGCWLVGHTARATRTTAIAEPTNHGPASARGSTDHGSRYRMSPVLPTPAPARVDTLHTLGVRYRIRPGRPPVPAPTAIHREPPQRPFGGCQWCGDGPDSAFRYPRNGRCR